jgi:hypothetical protein
MLTDISFAFEAYLERALEFFSRPEEQAKSHFKSEDDIRILFGYYQIEPGIYVCRLNADKSFSSLIDREKDMAPGTYGVADSHEQVLAYTKARDLDFPCVITLTPISRANQPETDGWRWSKWGPYIGTHQPQADYLADEPEINKVYVWRLHPLDPQKLALERRARFTMIETEAEMADAPQRTMRR